MEPQMGEMMEEKMGLTKVSRSAARLVSRLALDLVRSMEEVLTVPMMEETMDHKLLWMEWWDQLKKRSWGRSIEFPMVFQ